jgi:hypothetical protein
MNAPAIGRNAEITAGKAARSTEISVTTTLTPRDLEAALPEVVVAADATMDATISGAVVAAATLNAPTIVTMSDATPVMLTQERDAAVTVAAMVNAMMMGAPGLRKRVTMRGAGPRREGEGAGRAVRMSAAATS